MMDEYTITDQDAIQAVLTGHTQVAASSCASGYMILSTRHLKVNKMQ